MTSLTIRKFYTDNHGSVVIGFTTPERPKPFTLPILGYTWKWQESAKGWSRKDTVVRYQGELLRFTPFKSRATKPYSLLEGEVFLPVEATKGSLLLKELPS